MQSSAKDANLTRRQFVAAGAMAGAMGGAALAVGCKAGRHGNWDFLSDAQAATLTAVCDQIVPADDFPSASQAGVLVYIDRQLARIYRRHRNAYRDGLEWTEAMSRKRFGRGTAELAVPQLAELAGAIETQNPAFFNLVRNHTLEGYYGAPRHGGNRDAVSWRMLGMAEPPLRGRAQYDVRKGAAS
ncbi:MAG: gluconate 2-dehydrogenase subunit 3 family protein [Terracidiphilus sp.]